MKKNFLILAIIILLAGALPRSIELFSGNYLFGFDQGLFFEAVKEMVTNKKPTLVGAEVGGSGGFFQGPGWYYLLTIPFILTGGDPYGAMVLMFILGISAMAFSLVLFRKLLGEKEALLIGFLIAVSPAIIAQSRFIWPPFPTSLLTVFMLYALYRVFQGKNIFLPILSFVVGLMFHFEITTGATLLLQLVIFSPILFIKKLIKLKYLFLSLGSFLFTLLPLIIFDLRHNFLNFRGIIRLFDPDDSAHKVTYLYAKTMISNHFNTFYTNFTSTFQLSNVLWPILILILIIGSIFYIKDKKKTFPQKLFVFYLLISPILMFLVFTLYMWPMWGWWILELNIFYCFLLSIIFIYLWRKKLLKFLIITILFIFTLSFINQTINFYKNDFNDFGGTHKVKGKTEVIDYVYKDAKGKPFNLLVFSPPVYTYEYDYLLWWYAEKKYNYQPQKEKKGLFYLIIDPDPAKPWSYKGWLETVIKTGKVLETKTLPSGFIIQKRMAEGNEI